MKKKTETLKYLKKILKKNYNIELNEDLMNTQNLSKNTKIELYEKYLSLYSIFDWQNYLLKNKEKNEKALINSSKVVKDLEKEIQELWGFRANENYKTFEFEQPACSCPKLDNYERNGTGYFIYNENCLVHKDKIKKIKKGDEDEK